MHAFATDGSEPNNDRFSQASINMMDAVIATRGREPVSGHRLSFVYLNPCNISCYLTAHVIMCMLEKLMLLSISLASQSLSSPLSYTPT